MSSVAPIRDIQRYPEAPGSILQVATAPGVRVVRAEMTTYKIRLVPKGPIIDQPGPTVAALAALDEAARGASLVRRAAPGVYVIVK